MTEIRDARGNKWGVRYLFSVGFRKLRYLRVKGNRMGIGEWVGNTLVLLSKVPTL